MIKNKTLMAFCLLVSERSVTFLIVWVTLLTLYALLLIAMFIPCTSVPVGRTIPSFVTTVFGICWCREGRADVPDIIGRSVHTSHMAY